MKLSIQSSASSETLISVIFPSIIPVMSVDIQGYGTREGGDTSRRVGEQNESINIHLNHSVVAFGSENREFVVKRTKKKVKTEKRMRIFFRFPSSVFNSETFEL
jgi:hypothetical protein